MEQWKTIPSNTNYEASTEGQIRNAETKHILKPYKNNTGYLMVTLYGGQSSKLVSRLIAETFIDNPDNKPEIDHIDSNPLNNSVDNLRWVTRSENLRNPHRLELMKEVAKKRIGMHYSHKDTWEGNIKSEKQVEKEQALYDACKDLLDQGMKVAQVAKKVGVSTNYIYDHFKVKTSSLAVRYDKYIDEIVKYLKEGHTMRETADKFNINATTGMKYMADRYYKENGIKLASLKPSAGQSKKMQRFD